jgi:glycerol-3-phosphate acyltransferase PlsY
MIQILIIIGFCILTYLLCSIPFGKIIGKSKIGKLKSVDPQIVGSGNIGATNLSRTAGWQKGIITAVLDVAKAAIPVFLAKIFLQLDLQSGWQPNVILLFVIISALLGSIFPVWLKFKGGKGMSVLMGSLLVILGWKWWLLLLVCFVVTIIIAKRIVSIASLTLVGLFLLILGIIWQIIWHIPILCYLWLPASALIFWAHRENIVKLQKGEEPSYPIPNIFTRSKNKKPGLGT